MTTRSEARVQFYETVKQFHNESDINPRFSHTALEEYVKSQGGSAWDIKQEVFTDYSAWLRESKSSFVIPD